MLGLPLGEKVRAFCDPPVGSCSRRFVRSWTMEDVFSEGGTARGAYSPYNNTTPPTLSVTRTDTTCAQHTSDGNDQHSLHDACNDCAMGRGPAAAASSDATAVGQDDPLAVHASSSLACARSNDTLGCPHCRK